MLTTVEIRCAAYEARVLGTATYANDGTERGRNELTTPFRAIVAGGLLDLLARDLCGAAQGPAEEEWAIPGRRAPAITERRPK